MISRLVLKSKNSPNGELLSEQETSDEIKKGIAKSGLTHILAEEILKTESFALDEAGRLYRFKGGVYKKNGENFIHLACKRLMREWKITKKWKVKVGTECAEYIKLGTSRLWECPPLDMLNVKNGLLRIRDRVLLPHSPTHLSSIQLPVKYDAGAKCPVIEKFVSEVFPKDARDLAYEIIGWLMLADTSIQKAILLLGPGGNGKSTWLALLYVFLGRMYVSALSLHRLEADKFSVARLHGMLANICPDLPSDDLKSTSTFKAITGGDTMTGEIKFKDSFEFTPFCRLVFAANQPPRPESDNSEAFYDRWCVIPFEGRFRGEDEEISRAVLDAQLSTPAELSGLLNLALDGRERITRQGGFSEPNSVIDAGNRLRCNQDSFAEWLEYHAASDPEGVTPCKKLRNAYDEDCRIEGRTRLTKTGLGRIIKKHMPDSGPKQRTVNGKLQWCYIGFTLCDPVFKKSERGRGCSQASRC